MNQFDRLLDADQHEQKQASDASVTLEVHRTAFQHWYATVTVHDPDCGPRAYGRLGPTPEIAMRHALDAYYQENS